MKNNPAMLAFLAILFIILLVTIAATDKEPIDQSAMNAGMFGYLIGSGMSK